MYIKYIPPPILGSHSLIYAPLPTSAEGSPLKFAVEVYYVLSLEYQILSTLRFKSFSLHNVFPVEQEVLYFHSALCDGTSTNVFTPNEIPHLEPCGTDLFIHSFPMVCCTDDG